ncbi:flagellar hook-associated 2 domain protein [Psychromonas ingrahamii 37]|uniref:Flagellar hook-associated protein 2 n=1 Tax=Psychromonas ingrahamii (strain DSM 17664 / CCUG 51855 / 37) TaxID=357804 RepID=A1T0K4_PSYIN|nr:flagellar filament capping protein FliD [Psychromonas ingrahamii]ABM05269.1 flagellar hook-associated 2 domain protein [Psychromonas ingrahamii 37]
MIDPVSMATQLASWEVYPFETSANLRLKELSGKRSALSSINTELSAFNRTLENLSGYNKTVTKNSATSSDEDFLTAKAGAKAQAGNYQLFVEQLAQHHQLATQLPSGTTQDSFVPASGVLTMNINGESFTVDLAVADKVGNGELSYLDLVTAINNAPDNTGVSASLVISNGQIQLLFSGDKTGAENSVSISSSTADSVFDTAMNSNNMTELLKSQDAIAWLGVENSGLKLQNSSNEMEGVFSGVDLTLKKAHQSGEAGETIIIDADKQGTKDVMDALVKQYNKIASTIDKYSATGNTEGQSRGALASDPTTRSIKNSLRGVFQQTFDGITMGELGFEFSRDGTLSFDGDTFEAFQKTSTADIEEIFRGEGMFLSQLQGKLDIYNDNSSGTIKNQIESIDIQKSRVDNKLESLDRKYENFYARYLKQYTSLSTLQTQMNNISTMFSQY